MEQNFAHLEDTIKLTSKDLEQMGLTQEKPTTAYELLSPQEISDIFNNPDFKHNTNPNARVEFITFELHEKRLDKRFRIPKIDKEFGLYNEGANAEYLKWDKEQAELLLKKYEADQAEMAGILRIKTPEDKKDQNLVDTIKTVVVDQAPKAQIALKEMREIKPEPVSDVERFSRLIERAKARNDQKTADYFAERLKIAREKEAARQASEIRTDLKQEKNEPPTLDIKNEPTSKPEKATAPKKGFWSRLKNAFGGSKESNQNEPAEERSVEAFLDEPVPTPPQIKKIENGAKKGIPVNIEF